MAKTLPITEGGGPLWVRHPPVHRPFVTAQPARPRMTTPLVLAIFFNPYRLRNRILARCSSLWAACLSLSLFRRTLSLSFFCAPVSEARWTLSRSLFLRKLSSLSRLKSGLDAVDPQRFGP